MMVAVRKHSSCGHHPSTDRTHRFDLLLLLRSFLLLLLAQLVELSRRELHVEDLLCAAARRASVKGRLAASMPATNVGDGDAQVTGLPAAEMRTLDRHRLLSAHRGLALCSV